MADEADGAAGGGDVDAYPDGDGGSDFGGDRAPLSGGVGATGDRRGAKMHSSNLQGQVQSLSWGWFYFFSIAFASRFQIGLIIITCYIRTIPSEKKRNFLLYFPSHRMKQI